MFEQDDVENWVSITNVSRGAMARRLHLNSRMGLTSDDDGDQPAPGRLRGARRRPVGYGEYNQRDWLDDVVEPPRRRPRRAAPIRWAGHDAYGPALPFDDPRHLAAHHFLVEEAAIARRRRLGPLARRC